ncbi:MAG TPA: class I SAM-dependent methyltransferase [Steroidobacteraceae bacterium]|nr:class I SAM-dependent methyltransferase [Steroidobacteraceae bacterium]
MEPAEFDKYAARYRELHAGNIGASGEEPEYFSAYKARDLALELAQRQAVAPRVLDFGSGIGTLVPFLRQHVPDAAIVCVDVSRQSLAHAAAAHGETASFVAYGGAVLPFREGSFDAAIAACVFHHIDPGVHVALLRDLARVLRPGGLVMVYEHNPWNPLTRRAVDTCDLDRNAILIDGPTMLARMRSAGLRQCRLDYRVFFPAALRWLRPLEGAFRWLPAGAQYFVTGLR